MNEFNQMFARLTGKRVTESMRRIPIEELIGTGTNGVSGVGHSKCGCPGFRSMLPAIGGEYVCDGCNGYATKEDAETKEQEGKEGFERMLQHLSIRE